MTDKLNWLAFESGVLTERFQRRHLIVNYSILALALVLYCLGVMGTTIILLGCLPGLAVFIVSLEALAWKMAIEGEDMMQMWIGMMR